MLDIAEIKKVFPNFEPNLIDEIEQFGVVKCFQNGDILMKTEQYFRSSMLIVKGVVKVYREDDEGRKYSLEF